MAVTLWSVRRSRTELADRLPFALILAIGVAWWLWLQPSWLGAMIVLIGVASWLRDRRARQQQPVVSAVISVRSRG